MSAEITIGICAYNEGNNIGKLLDNVLSKQDLPVDSEVLVVCSGCTDNTREVVSKYAAKDLRVKPFFEKERAGKASAINYILDRAIGDVIILVSADTLPRKRAFLRLLSKLQSKDVGLVSGNPIPENSTNCLVGRMVHLLWRFHGYVFKELNDAGLARHATELFCLRKGIVKRIPAETINDDAFIAVTVKKKGWRIKYSEESIVSMRGPGSYPEYFQQRRRIIFGHYQLRRLTGESPQYLLHMLPFHPIWVARLVLWLSTKYDPLTIITFLLTEFFVNLTAFVDFGLGKTHRMWMTIPSTKIVLTNDEKDPA